MNLLTVITNAVNSVTKPLQVIDDSLTLATNYIARKKQHQAIKSKVETDVWLTEYAVSVEQRKENALAEMDKLVQSQACLDETVRSVSNERIQSFIQSYK